MKKEIKSLLSSAKDITSGYLKDGKIKSKNPSMRLFICKGCQSFTDPKCNECGCYMPFKVKFEHAKCPKGMW